MADKSFLLRLYSLVRNPMSVIGLLITLISTAIGLPLMFADFLFGQSNPYAGIITYLVLPIVSTLGVVLALLGIYWNWKKNKHDPSFEPVFLPRIDFNKPRHQKIALGVIVGSSVLVILLALTSYRAYHFSDSVEFCGKACHEVMKPEYTAYQHSPHARVACVQCHIGPGAGWFVKSKITGAYQVYSVMFDKFSRPIETPIKDLRPAQDTCEQCHWPEKFFGAQQKTFTHYLSDENNSPWQIQALLKIGGGDSKTGAASGIHWHMNINNDIYYKDPSGKRDVIPWVKAVSKDGKVTEYKTTETSLSDSEIAALPEKRMDCLDCHNRPSHVFPPPTVALDKVLSAGLLDASLPYIKREAINVMKTVYATEKEALAGIETGLLGFYQAEYPDLFQKERPRIDSAIKTVQDVFARTIFPEMKADWRAYPDHLSHLTSEGCFRCHDGLHQSADGKVITNDCNACHTILAQGAPETIAKARLQTQAFVHPVDVGMDVTGMKCSDCHSGKE